MISQVIRRNLYFVRFIRCLLSKTSILHQDALNVVSQCHYKERPNFSQKNVIQPEYDLMIVIPVYNGEHYLDDCLQSVLRQKTKYSFCMTIVDDGSTDGSPKILEKYEKYPFCKIIHQANKGQAGARNRGLKEIFGRYVMFLDSDDTLTENAVEVLLSTAFEQNADMVAGGFELFEGDHIINVEKYGDYPIQVSPWVIPGYTCMKVFHSKLLSDFAFPEQFFFEDTVLPRLVYQKCKIAFTVPQIVYRYRNHQMSFSRTFDRQKRCLETFWITKYCLEEAFQRGYPLCEDDYVQYLQQSWVNWFRTKEMSREIQESMFILTCGLYEKFFGTIKLRNCAKKYRWLAYSMKRKSYAAYVFVLQRWDSI